jgi:hypothetical protein
MAMQVAAMVVAAVKARWRRCNIARHPRKMVLGSLGRIGALAASRVVVAKEADIVKLRLSL